jgi:hypothetical protein
MGSGTTANYSLLCKGNDALNIQPSLRHQTGTSILHIHAYQIYKHSTCISGTIVHTKESLGSSVAIITGRMARVRIPAAARDFFSSPQRPHRLWGPRSSRCSFSGGKTTTYFHLAQRSRMVEPNLHSLICLHGTGVNVR